MFFLDNKREIIYQVTSMVLSLFQPFEILLGCDDENNLVLPDDDPYIIGIICDSIWLILRLEFNSHNWDVHETVRVHNLVIKNLFPDKWDLVIQKIMKEYVYDSDFKKGQEHIMTYLGLLYDVLLPEVIDRDPLIKKAIEIRDIFTEDFKSIGIDKGNTPENVKVATAYLLQTLRAYLISKQLKGKEDSPTDW